MSNNKGLKSLEEVRSLTGFSSDNQPSPEAKKLGWEKRRLSKTIRDSLISELAKEVFDTVKNEVITEAESFALGLLQEWKTTKDPRYAKLIMEFMATNNELPEISQAPIKVIIQTSGNRFKND